MSLLCKRTYKKSLIILGIGIFFSQFAFAQKTILTISTGSTFASSVGKPQYIPATPPTDFSFYSYSANHAPQYNPLLGIFLGKEFLLNRKWSVQAGIAYYQPQDFRAKGQVTQGADVPSENVYPYSYNIESKQVLIESKVLFKKSIYHPYFSLGLGMAANTAKSFEVQLSPPFTTFSNQFTTRHKSSFAYGFGFGMDVDFGRHTRLGGGYRFYNLGKIGLGTAVIDDTANGNTLPQFYLRTSEVLVQLSYLLY